MKFYPRAALLVWLLVLATSAWLISRTPIVADLTAFLPESATANQRLLIDQLRDGVASRLILIALEGDEPKALAEASRKIAAQLDASGLFASVSNGDAALLARERDLLMRHRYLLSPKVTPQRFSEQGLRDALQNSLQTLASPLGGMLRTILPADPTGELLQLVAPLAGSGPAMQFGVWFSGDARRALLIAETRATGFDVDRQQQAIDVIKSAAAQFPRIGVLMTGAGVFAAESRQRIEGDAWRLSLIAGIIVALILFAVYRSLLVVALGMLPVATGLLVGIAAVGLAFGSVHGITLGFGATLIGEAADYPSYLFTHVRRNERVGDTLRRVWPTLRLAILTTVFGSAAMLLSSFNGLSQLGVLSFTGVLAAGLVTRWVLPSLAPREFNVFEAAARLPIERVAGARRLRWLIWPAAIVALIFIASRYPAVWSDDLERLSPIAENSKVLDQQLRAQLQAPDVRFLLVARGATQENAQIKSERAVAKLDDWVARGVIAGFDLAARYLPSNDAQLRRRAALPDEAALRSNLAAAMRDTPFQPESFAPFLKDVARARISAPITLADLEGSALALKTRSLLFESGGDWIALIALHGVDEARLRAAAAELADAGIALIDLKAESNAMVNSYRDESLRLVALGVAVIVMVLAIGLRNARAVARVMLPVLLAALIAIAALLALGQLLTLFHLVSLLLVIGIGLNYSLFFHRAPADPEERRRTLLSLLVCSATTLTAFGCLAFSEIPVLRAIGLTVSFGAAASLAIAAALAKPVNL